MTMIHISTSTGDPREDDRRAWYECMTSKCTTEDGTRRPWSHEYTRNDAIDDLKSRRQRPPGFCADRWKRILNGLAPHLCLPYDRYRADVPARVDFGIGETKDIAPRALTTEDIQTWEDLDALHAFQLKATP